MIKVAKIILLDKYERLVLQLRDNKPDIVYPNFWAEIGGQIEKDESPIEALNREIKEEISCRVYNISFLSKFYVAEHDCELYMFKGKINDRINNITLYEGQRLGLFELKDLDKIKIVPKLKEYILNNKGKIFRKLSSKR